MVTVANSFLLVRETDFLNVHFALRTKQGCAHEENLKDLSPEMMNVLRVCTMGIKIETVRITKLILILSYYQYNNYIITLRYDIKKR